MMSRGIKRPFCLDAHRVTDLAAFPIQSFENEALTRLIMPLASGSLQFWLLSLKKFLAKYILCSKASFHSHSYFLSISICSYSLTIILLHPPIAVSHVCHIVIQCNHSFIVCVCVCVRACMRVCVNNIFLFTHSPLLFTVNHLHYEKKVDVSIQTHFLNTISLQYEKNCFSRWYKAFWFTWSCSYVVHTWILGTALTDFSTQIIFLLFSKWGQSQNTYICFRNKKI